MRSSHSQRSASPRRRSGFVLILGTACLSILALILVGVVGLALRESRRNAAEARDIQAQFLAEAGAERAMARLASDATYQGETWETATSESGPRFAPSRVTIAVQPAGPRNGTITVAVDYPSNATLHAHVSQTFPYELSPPSHPEDTP